MTSKIPRYADLPRLEKIDHPHAWDVFGAADQLGSLNHVTRQRRLAAVATVETGEVVNLSVPIKSIDPPLFDREPLRHTVFSPDRNSLDDRLDAFFLQGSSQWDGLKHIRAREFGYWGGRTDQRAIEDPAGPLGIEHWILHGMIGRGVVLDVAAYREAETEHPYDPFVEESIDAACLDSVAAWSGVDIKPGDFVCIRTGWMGRYQRLPRRSRVAGEGTRQWVGLSAGEDMAEWAWDHQVAAVAADNPSVEVSPGSPEVGSLHRRLLPLLGIALGELFALDDLVAKLGDRREKGFLFASVPLYVDGGVGSPANAVAVL